MAVEIPTTASFPDYRQAVVLGDRVYRLHFVYNARNDSWYVDIADASGAVVRAGLRLRARWSCNHQHVDDRLPDGLIFALRLDGTDAEPARNDPGKLLALVFAPRSELPAPS